MTNLMTDRPETPPQLAPEVTTPEPSTKGRVSHVIEAYTLALLVLGFIVFFSVLPSTSETFPTVANFQAILGNHAVAGIVTLAALIPLIARQFDLSVGAAAGLSGIYAGDAMAHGTPIVVAVLIGIGIGALVGTINATLVTRFGLNDVVATLGTSTLIAGLITMKTGGQSIIEVPNSVVNFGTSNTLGIPRPALVLLGVAVLVYYVLNYTPLGRYLYAIGSNTEASRLVGLPTRFTLAWSFIAAGTLAGAAGVLQVARAGGADPRVGQSLTLAALAAAFLSAASVRPGQYNVVGAMIAVFFLAVLNAGLNLAGAEPYVADYVNGSALILGVALAVFLGRRRSRR